MRYIQLGGEVIPKNCIYGPRPAEGIVFNNYEWWSITDHLVREQREREMAAICKAKEEAKKNLSFGMTSTWNNTLASIKTQGNQKRLEKMEREKQDKIDKYHQIIKNKKEENREILENVKKVLFKDKDPVKTINSAVWYSTVFDGWRKQIEMKEMFNLKQAKEEKELALKFKREAEEVEREKLHEEIKKKARAKIHKQQLDVQMAEVRRRKQEEVDEFHREEQDLKNMTLEGERIHRCNMVEKEHRKKFAAKYTGKTESQLEYERKLALEQEEEDEINKMYKEYARKFKRERKEREERIKNEAIERRMKISEMLAQKMAESALREEESFLSAVREKEELAQKEEEEKKEKQRQALESLLEGKKRAMEMRARQQYEKKEREKWDMIQQYRSAEVNEEWRRQEEQREQEKRRKMTAAFDCQKKQAEEKRAQELKEWLEPLEDEEAEKAEMLQYCEETMRLIKEHNLPEYPVRKAITEAMKSYGIEDKEQQELNEKRKEQEREQRDSRKSRPLGKGCYCLKY